MYGRGAERVGRRLLVRRFSSGTRLQGFFPATGGHNGQSLKHTPYGRTLPPHSMQRPVLDLFAEWEEEIIVEAWYSS
jgi:hypothetical protein